MVLNLSKYGDLGATVAAVLLHPEARSSTLDAYPYKGGIKEPLIRLMHLMKSLELQKAEGEPILKMVNLDQKIGEMAHCFPSVFSFYLPEYETGGRIGAASLVAPEAMITGMPTQISLHNGMFSMIDYGMSTCYGGFGASNTHCSKGSGPERAPAYLSFTPSATDADSVVNDLSLLLTGGRLGEYSKEIIKNAYIAKLNESGDEGAALRLAEQLVVSCPEFHTTNIVHKTGELRAEAPAPQGSGAPYKAVVFVMFGGGCDSYNMLVPHTCTIENDANETLYDEYVGIRDVVALAVEDLNELNGTLITNQACETFGTHPQLKTVQEMFDERDLLFFANAG